MGESRSLTFLSSRGGGFYADLKLAQNFLTDRAGEGGPAYRFFLNHERTAGPPARRGIALAREQFCQGADHILCADLSLAGAVEKYGRGVRLLMAAPCEYQFRAALSRRKRDGRKKALRHFTHILSGSPFAERVLGKYYDLEGIRMLSGLSLPLAWDICREPARQAVREKLAFYFPGIRGKKLLAIVTGGSGASESPLLAGFQPRRLLGQLAGEWFVMTNAPEIREKAGELDASFRSCFGFADRVLQRTDFLYAADVLVTNSGRLAACFASRKKPVYCAAFRGNHFETFMRRHYPGMYLPDFPALARAMEAPEDFSGEQRRFNRDFCYEELRSPYETLKELFK